MQSQDISVESFEKTLHDLLENLQQFVVSLDTEKALLEQNKSDELIENLTNKRLIIESLDAISNQCQAFFQSPGVFNDKAILSVIAQFAPNKQLYLLELWNTVKNLVKTCDKKNLVNGIMITTLKNYNDNMLSIITNRPKESVYGNQYKKTQLAVSTREHKA